MMEYLSERFAPGPVFAWACIVCLLIIPVVWWRYRAPKTRAPLRYSSTIPLQFVHTTWVTRTRFLIPLLRTLAIVALVVALARPQSSGAYRDTSEGIAIQMVLDVSGSMAEEDFLVDGRRARRLDAVKGVFEDFVLGSHGAGGRQNDLIGMTTFAMFAESPCPLTLDHASLVNLLEETDIPGWVNGQQVRQQQEAGYTALGDAIVLATDDLRRAGEQAVAGVPGAEAAKSRVMILLTDGADNPASFDDGSPPDPVEAAKLAGRLGIKIYTIGAAGDAPSTRGPFGMLMPRRRAQVDEGTLKQVADATGGKYFRATDTDSLRTIYEEIDQLERRSTGERTYRDNIYAAKIAMLVGLALLMTELLLANTRYRRLP